jgi:predicted RNA-binding Zn-ribbon protein involved in translation (DUF1610 family)
MKTTPNKHQHSRTCPKCGSDEILRSQRRGLDKLLSIANLYPYRCRNYNCETRFYSFGNDADRDYSNSGLLSAADRPY